MLVTANPLFIFPKIKGGFINVIRSTKFGNGNFLFLLKAQQHLNLAPLNGVNIFRIASSKSDFRKVKNANL